MKNRFAIRRLVCLCLALMMLPLGAFTAFADEGGASYNFAKGQKIESDNSYIPPEGFFDVSFLNDGEWLTIEGANMKLGWNTDPYISIGETDPVEITISLDAFYRLEKIVIYPMKWSNGVNFPREYELLGSADGSEWFEVYAKQSDLSAEAADNLSVQPKEYVLDTPISIRYFKLRITRHSTVVDATGAATSALGEIELYGVKDAAAEEDAAKKLAEAKETAKTELETYRAGKDNKDYREAQVAELDAALTKGLEAVDAAASTGAVTSAVTSAKKALDAVKTDAQLTAEETEAPTEAPTEPETEEPTEEPTETPTETPTEEPTEAPTDGETRAPADDTEAPTDAPTEMPTDEPAPTPDPKGGCGSVMGMGVSLLLTALAAAFVWGRKNRD